MYIQGFLIAVPEGNKDAYRVQAEKAGAKFREYGVTEIVAVDSHGRTVFQSQIVVSAGDSGQVRVWRGSQVTEMACGTTCSPTARSTGTP